VICIDTALPLHHCYDSTCPFRIPPAAYVHVLRFALLVRTWYASFIFRLQRVNSFKVSAGFNIRHFYSAMIATAVSVVVLVASQKRRRLLRLIENSLSNVSRKVVSFLDQICLRSLDARVKEAPCRQLPEVPSALGDARPLSCVDLTSMRVRGIVL